MTPQVMAGAGAEARAARLQHLDGLLEMPRPEEFDQVLTLHALPEPRIPVTRCRRFRFEAEQFAAASTAFPMFRWHVLLALHACLLSKHAPHSIAFAAHVTTLPPDRAVMIPTSSISQFCF